MPARPRTPAPKPRARRRTAPARRRTPAAPRRARPARARVPEGPRFSVTHLDRSVDPRRDFYRFAAGGWIRAHPVPADKSRWGGFSQVAEHSFDRLHGILDEVAAAKAPARGSVEQLVGDFYRAATETRARNARRFDPLRAELARIGAVATLPDLVDLLADLHGMGVGGFFDLAVFPDRRRSDHYAVYLWQGGISLPDRDYYLKEEFAAIRAAYLRHLTAVFRLLGRPTKAARASAASVLAVETELARAGRSQTELRDSVKNYHRTTPSELVGRHPTSRWSDYLARRGFGPLEYLVVGQPEFFDVVETMLTERPVADWRPYLEWQLLHAAAPYLHTALEDEDFAFFHRTLLGQKTPEPRWRRAARETDGALGEALGRLYVERYFPETARRRMAEMIDDLRAVFADRLSTLPWMTPETRRQAKAKFDRFTAKIGHPERFRDYSKVPIAPDDYLGNVRAAARFEIARQVAKAGRPVDRSEWHMTPPTVNAYFDATQNEIVFPAGILQPHFFDATMDDAVNYGGIGTVIGHEITHGYDDQGRQYDADGNLKDWWTPKDAEAFDARAKGIIDQYNGFEALPGLHVNGELTQGENIADFGGVSIAFEALQRRLAADPARRRVVDGFTPEQRFFLAYAQIWRENIREPELRRRITVDPHSPGRFRAVGPLMNFPPFFEAFGIREGDPMRRPADRCTTIW